MYDEYFDEELQNIFAGTDVLDLTYDLKNANRNSVTTTKVVRGNKQSNVDIKKLRKAIINISLCTALLVSGVKMAESTYEKINSPLSEENISKSIGMLVNAPQYKMGEYVTPRTSILGQNIIGTGPGNYRYENKNIAKDLLKLDYRLFDYAFADVCRDMGSNIDNKVEIGGRSNIEAVIMYLKDYSTSEQYKNAYVNNAFHDVETLDEYLIKYGHLDKEGKPSLEQFYNSCREKVSEIYELIEQELEEKGVNRS